MSYCFSSVTLKARPVACPYQASHRAFIARPGASYASHEHAGRGICDEEDETARQQHVSSRYKGGASQRSPNRRSRVCAAWWPCMHI